MSAELRCTILGCGSSGGVPRLSLDPAGNWGACDPGNPKNRRRRCSLLVERVSDTGTTRVLIDSSPDFREQMLSAGIGTLDAVIYTHAHADHVHGIDDLRMIVFNTRKRLPVWADAETSDALCARFGYVFVQPEGSSYPPILDLHLLEGPVSIDGAGGQIRFTPLPVTHGRINALGFRMGDIAYMPDVSDIPEATWPLLEGLDTWILDALRYEPHPSHAHLDLSLSWMARAAPKHGVITNMHIDLDWAEVEARTPDHIRAAFDGMVLRAPAG